MTGERGMRVKEIRIGGLAKSIAGRDKERMYMIVGQEGETLLLSDGKYRPLSAPKRKNRRHVSLQPVFFPEIAERIAQGKDENSQIRAALKAPVHGAAEGGK